MYPTLLRKPYDPIADRAPNNIPSLPTKVTMIVVGLESIRGIQSLKVGLKKLFAPGEAIVYGDVLDALEFTKYADMEILGYTVLGETERVGVQCA
jgi:hypothetical protein